jgi:hypothetical protein
MGRTVAERKAMIMRSHKLPVGRQARALGISRGSVYYLPRPIPDADLAVMRCIDALHMDYPFAGSRMLRDLLGNEGIKVGRLHVATLMKSEARSHAGGMASTERRLRRFTAVPTRQSARQGTRYTRICCAN